jgi:hypothetical protein
VSYAPFGGYDETLFVGSLEERHSSSLRDDTEKEKHLSPISV